MKDKGLLTKRMLSNLAVVVVGVLLYIALSNVMAVRGAISKLFSVLSPFIIGITIAYLLNIPMCFFEEKVFKRFHKKQLLAILTTYILALLLFVLLLGMIIPQLIDSIYTLINNIQTYFDNINDLIGWIGEKVQIERETTEAVMVSYQDLVNEALSYVRGIFPEIINMTMRLGTLLVSGLTALIASIYMLSSKKSLLQQCCRMMYAILPKHHADNLMRISKLSNGVFAGFIGGKIIDSAIIGVICFVFMTLANLTIVEMPYALLISVIIGVTNIIPFFGPFIGAIPSILIILMVNPWSVLWFIIFIIVLQQFDGNYLGPKILGNTTGLPAMWVLISIVVGGGLFGFTGMLLGVPTVAVLYTLISDFVENQLSKKGLVNIEMIQEIGITKEEKSLEGDIGTVDEE
jgi:Predicted permease